MALFKNMAITEKGMALYAKAQAGQPIVFTKMRVGSGDLGTQNPATLLALIDGKLDVPISSITPNPELKSATIVGNITNTGILEAMYICEIGIFATDPDEGEILYGYSNCGSYGDYYAPEAQGPYSWQYQISTAIGNAANVTAELTQLNYDYGIAISSTNFMVLSGGNQKEVNKNIDLKLKSHDDSIAGISTHLADKTQILVAGGTANAITLPVTLADKSKYSFKATANSTGAVTINTVALKKTDGTAVSNLKVNKVYDIYYDATASSVFILAKAEGDALVGDVLAGKVFSNGDDTGLVGSLTLTGNATIADVNAGKTFYSTNAKSKLVGTFIQSTVKSVQRGSLIFNDYVSGKRTININTIDPSKSIALIHYTPLGQAREGTIMIDIVNSTTIEVSTYYLGSPINVYWEVVEFENIKSKQSGVSHLGEDKVYDIPISIINPAKTMIIKSLKTTLNSNSTNSTNVGATIQSSTILRLERAFVGAGYNIAVAWQLVEFN